MMSSVIDPICCSSKPDTVWHSCLLPWGCFLLIPGSRMLFYSGLTILDCEGCPRTCFASPSLVPHMVPLGDYHLWVSPSSPTLGGGSLTWLKEQKCSMMHPTMCVHKTFYKRSCLPGSARNSLHCLRPCLARKCPQNPFPLKPQMIRDKEPPWEKN